MHRQIASLVLTLAVIGFAPSPTAAQSLSQGLGATKLDGLKNFTDCQNQTVGYRERLIGDRLDARLAKSPALNEQEREAWAADIRALRAVKAGQPFKAPDPQNSQRYLMGLTDKEQVSINSMTIRFTQEVGLACEQKFGGMARNSPGQARYEQSLRDKMGTPIDIATIPVGPLDSPFPKAASAAPIDRAAVAGDRRAAREATRAANQQAMSGCADSVKGLRLTLMADRMQRSLDGAKGLSAADRAAFEADIRLARDGAAKGLDMPDPADPRSMLRVMQRLAPQDQMEVATDFGKQYTEKMMACMRR